MTGIKFSLKHYLIESKMLFRAALPRQHFVYNKEGREGDSNVTNHQFG